VGSVFRPGRDRSHFFRRPHCGFGAPGGRVGEWNYLLKVRIRNTKELEAFLSGTIKAVRGVERTQTLITLSTAKETWALEVPRRE
jgi:hypothetical protein